MDREYIIRFVLDVFYEALKVLLIIVGMGLFAIFAYWVVVFTFVLF